MEAREGICAEHTTEDAAKGGVGELEGDGEDFADKSSEARTPAVDEKGRRGRPAPSRMPPYLLARWSVPSLGTFKHSVSPMTRSHWLAGASPSRDTVLRVKLYRARACQRRLRLLSPGKHVQVILPELEGYEEVPRCYEGTVHTADGRDAEAAAAAAAISAPDERSEMQTRNAEHPLEHCGHGPFGAGRWHLGVTKHTGRLEGPCAIDLADLLAPPSEADDSAPKNSTSSATPAATATATATVAGPRRALVTSFHPFSHEFLVNIVLPSTWDVDCLLSCENNHSCAHCQNGLESKPFMQSPNGNRKVCKRECWGHFCSSPAPPQDADDWTEECHDWPRSPPPSMEYRLRCEIQDLHPEEDGRLWVGTHRCCSQHPASTRACLRCCMQLPQRLDSDATDSSPEIIYYRRACVNTRNDVAQLVSCRAAGRAAQMPAQHEPVAVAAAAGVGSVPESKSTESSGGEFKERDPAAPGNTSSESLREGNSNSSSSSSDSSNDPQVEDDTGQDDVSSDETDEDQSSAWRFRSGWLCARCYHSTRLEELGEDQEQKQPQEGCPQFDYEPVAVPHSKDGGLLCGCDDSCLRQVRYISPRFTDCFCVHGKIMLLDFGSILRVVVSSFNLSERQWYFAGDTFWWADLRRLPDGEQASSRFCTALADMLKQIGLHQWVDTLCQFDNPDLDVDVDLLVSIPGQYSKRNTSVGDGGLALQRALNRFPQDEAIRSTNRGSNTSRTSQSADVSPVFVQVWSVGGAGPRWWEEFAQLLLSPDSTRLRLAEHLHCVRLLRHPRSHGQYFENQLIARPMMYYDPDDPLLRSRAGDGPTLDAGLPVIPGCVLPPLDDRQLDWLWHSKVMARFLGENHLQCCDSSCGKQHGWVYVGSHNCSKSSWGGSAGRDQWGVRNFEVGVLISSPPAANRGWARRRREDSTPPTTCSGVDLAGLPLPFCRSTVRPWPSHWLARQDLLRTLVVGIVVEHGVRGSQRLGVLLLTGQPLDLSRQDFEKSKFRFGLRERHQWPPDLGSLIGLHVSFDNRRSSIGPQRLVSFLVSPRKRAVSPPPSTAESSLPSSPSQGEESDSVAQEVYRPPHRRRGNAGGRAGFRR